MVPSHISYLNDRGGLERCSMRSMCEMLAQEFGFGRFDGRHCHQRLVRSLRVILPLFSLSDSPMFSCRPASYTPLLSLKAALSRVSQGRRRSQRRPKPLLISASLRPQAAKVKVWVLFNYGLQTIFLISVYPQFCTNVFTT